MVHLGAQLGRVFERMQAKEMLYKAYDELEMRVRKRTEDLAKANTDLQAEINERKRSELALSHLAAIVESSGDAITGATLEGTILSWNSGAERIYGYPVGEVKGRSLSILVPPEMSHEELQILEKIAEAEKIEVSDQEIDGEIEALARQTRQTAEAIRARLTREGALDRIRGRLRNEKALDFLYRRSA